MGNIFERATCTIAATCAEDKNDGLFKDHASDYTRNPAGELREDFVRLPCLYKNARIYGVCISRNLPETMCYDEPERTQHNREIFMGRWVSRGWVKQERILSRRILHFGAHQLFYECQQQLLREFNTELTNFFMLHAKHTTYDRLLKETTLANRFTASSQAMRSLRALTYLTIDKVKDSMGSSMSFSASPTLV